MHGTVGPKIEKKWLPSDILTPGHHSCTGKVEENVQGGGAGSETHIQAKGVEEESEKTFQGRKEDKLAPNTPWPGVGSQFLETCCRS